MNLNYNFGKGRLNSLFPIRKLEEKKCSPPIGSAITHGRLHVYLMLMLMLLIGQSTIAQVANYAFSESVGTYTPITGGTVLATATGNSLAPSVDDVIFNIPSGTIPFTFTYDGVGYTGMNVSSNGFITFGATAPSTNNYSPISSTEGYAGAISAHGVDSNGLFITGIIGEIRYQTIGTAPNRVFVVQWSNWREYDTTTASPYFRVNFQIRLSENGTINLVYDSSVVGTPPNVTMQVGLRGPNNTFATNVKNRLITNGTHTWNTSVAGTSNSSTCGFRATLMPVSGKTFTFTPPTPPSCGSPTGLAVTDIKTTTADIAWVAPSAGTPATYDWEIRTSGAGGTGATGLATSGSTTAPTVSVNDVPGLTENTAYNLYVRTNCSGGNGSSTWTGPVAFTTKKSCPAGLGAGSVTIAGLPYSASGLTNSAAGNNVTATNVACVAGSTSYYGGEDKTYIFTPTSTGVYTILLTTATDDDAGIMLYQGCPFTTGSVCVANAQSTTGLTRTLTPTLTGGVTYYLVVDNFPAPAFIGSYSLSISLPPTCGVPTGLSATDITFATVDLNWVAPSTGTPASYDWEIRTSGAGGSGASGLTNSGNVTAPAVTVDNASGLSGGTSYSFYVRTNCSGGDGSSSWAGPFAFATPTPGETCVDAQTIAVAANLASAVNTLLTTGLTADGPAGTCSDATGNPNKKDRWVKFVAPTNGNKVVITTSSGTISDAVMQVWSSCPASGSALGCSDDVNGLMPELSFCANQYTPGATYYVQVWPYSATATGNFNIRIYEDAPCPVPPTNDECSGVQTLTVEAPGNCPANAVTGTTVNATATPGVVKTSCDLFGTYLDVFYKFNTGSNTSLNLAFTNLTGTCEFGLYSGCGTGYLNVCSSSSSSNLLTGLTPNTDYYIVVWSNSIATQGTFSLCISQVPAPGCVAAPTAPVDGGSACAGSTTLSWPTVANATNYDVFLDGNLVSDNQTATSYTQVIAPGSHTWKVVPSNSTGEASGCVDFTFTSNAAPVGDVFANPIELGALTASTTINGDNLSSNCWNDNFNSTSTPGSANGRLSNDVFYKFDITQCGSLINIGLCTSSYDTYIHLLDSSGATVAFDDDSCSTPNDSGSLMSGLNLGLGTYYIVVEGFGTNSGTYTLDISYTAGTTPNTFYADADGDGFGNPNMTLVSCAASETGYVLNNTDCNDNQIQYFDGDGDGYGTAVQVACGVALTGDCNDTNAAVNPAATEVCYDGIDNNCDGTIDEGCTPIISVVQTAQCGSTLSSINQQIFANLVAGAQGYRFRVTDMTTNQVQTIDRNLRVFQLTQLTNYAFDRTYQVEVSIRFNNVWQPFYGAPCSVTTPATTTQIQTAQCGGTLTTISDVIYANNVPFATGYRFRITNLVTSAQEVVDRPLRDVKMTQTSIAEFNSTYSVEVAVRNTNGTYLPYGTACNVTTPSFPTTQLQLSQCDVILTNPNAIIYADSYAGATTYRFRFTNTSLDYSYQFDKPLRSFELNTVPGLLPGETYSVQVSIEIGGVFGPFGKVCTLTTPGATKTSSDTSKSVLAFNAIVSPNPFGESFGLEVSTSNQENIQVKVYDMLGKLVESKEIDSTSLSELQIGATYPSGVYNVIVSQGDEVKTLRVIKR